MSRYYNPSRQPLIDYSYHAPIEAIAQSLAARQQAYDTNTGLLDQYSAYGDIQALPDEIIKGEYIGDTTEAKALHDKYQKLREESLGKYNGDASQISGDLRKIKAEIAKDYGPAGIATAISSRYKQYSDKLGEIDTGISAGNYNEGDQGAFFSGLTPIKSGNTINSTLGIPSLSKRADYDTAIPAFMKAAIKDKKNVTWEKSPDGRYLVKNTETGVTEADLTDALTGFLHSMPEHMQWKERDLKKTIEAYNANPGDSPYFQAASDANSTQILNAKSNIEQIDKALRNPKINDSLKAQYLADKKLNQDLIDKLDTTTNDQLAKTGLDLISSSYDQRFIDPYMSRAGLSIDKDVKTDQYAIAAYRHALKLDEIDYKAKKDKEAILGNIIATPGIITPTSSEDINKSLESAKDNNKDAKQAYTKSTMAIYSELAKVNPELNSLLNEYNSLQTETDINSLKREQEIQTTIQSQVKGWMNDLNNGKDTGTYASVLKQNYIPWLSNNDTYQSTLDNLNHAENAGELQAQFIMTPVLDTKLNDVREVFSYAKNLPPELQKALASGDNNKLLALASSGKLDTYVSNYFKMGIPGNTDNVYLKNGTQLGPGYLDGLKMQISTELKNANKSSEKKDAYNSNINFDLSQKDPKGYIAQTNAALTESVTTGFGGYQSWTGENMEDKIAKETKNGIITKRELQITSANIDGKPLATAYIQYKDKNGKTKEYKDYVVMDNTNMSTYNTAFAQMANEEGKIGSLGRMVVAQNNLQGVNSGDFLENSIIGKPFVLGKVGGANVQFLVTPLETAIGTQYNVSMQGTDLNGKVLSEQPVINRFTQSPTMYDYNNILENIGYEMIGK